MANITINSVSTRVQYTATAGQTVYTYNFPIKAQGDLKVYSRASSASPDDATDILTITTEYTVTGANTSDGGTVTLVTPSTVGDIVTIVGDKTIDRTAIYNQSSTLKKADLNNDFNDNVMYDKQINTIADQLTPKYNRSELIYRDPSNSSNDVRADNLFLPILNDGYIWVGRGDNGDDPDDIVATAIGDFDALGILSAEYVLGTAVSALPNAQSLGALTTGFLYNTVVGSTGTLSIVDPGELGTEVITVTQAAHGLLAEKWIYRDAGTNAYAYALADDATTAEAIGVIVEVVDVNTFKMQQSGFNDGDLSGLTDGSVYYLSDSSAGDITTTAPTAAGSYTKPVLVATAADGGWILSHRTLSTSASDSPVTETITQNGHGYNVGDFVYRDGGTNDYQLAQADSAANAESVGMIISTTANTFVLQTIGYVADLTGFTWGATVDGTVYFLSPTTAGEATSTQPITDGQINKPVFIADGVSSGWLLHYRGNTVSAAAATAGMIPIVTVTISSDTTVDIDNVFDSTYDAYLIVGTNIVPSVDSSIRARVGTGAGPTYQATNYKYVIDRTNTAPVSSTAAATSGTYWELSGTQVGFDTGESINFAMYLHDPSSAAMYTYMHLTGVQKDNVGVFIKFEGGGCWDDATAVTSLQLHMSAVGNIVSGEITVYGLNQP
jgi:hypothetical protein